MLGSSQVTRARARVEEQMVDSCVIGRVVRSDELDENGDYPETLDPVYVGRCKFTIQAVQVRDVDSQGQDFSVADGILSIPVGALGSAEVEKDHRAQITLTSNDSAIIDAVVQSGHAQTFATARRFPVQILT